MSYTTQLHRSMAASEPLTATDPFVGATWRIRPLTHPEFAKSMANDKNANAFLDALREASLTVGLEATADGEVIDGKELHARAFHALAQQGGERKFTMQDMVEANRASADHVALLIEDWGQFVMKEEPDEGAEPEFLPVTYELACEVLRDGLVIPPGHGEYSGMAMGEALIAWIMKTAQGAETQKREAIEELEGNSDAAIAGSDGGAGSVVPIQA